MSEMIKVWDLPTRLFHWGLAVLFIFMIISGDSEDLMQWHFYAGYILCGMILFRIVWGFLGTRYARFSSFKLNPVSVLSYIRNLLKSENKAYYGHTPAGSLVVVIMMLLLSVQLITGLMSTDDILWNGPLYNSVSEASAELAGQLHESIQTVLQLLVALHVLAIILYKVKFRESLAPAMIHGKKEKQELAEGEEAREGVSWLKLVISIIPAVGLTYWLFSLPI